MTAQTPMTWDTRSPCEKCPYRKDAPRGLWHPDEFRRLLASENEAMGRVYGCHKQNGRPCIGWLLDQRERGCPSIRLRLILLREPEAVRCMEDSTSGGHALFKTVAAMCRANGVKP